MFKRFTVIICILGIISLVTEAIYRFRSNNNVTDMAYTTQSNMVITTAVIIIIFSIQMLKMMDYISIKAMRLIALLSMGLLCVSIVLRSKYGFLIPTHAESINYLYNATSFLICVNTASWLPFFIYKKVVKQQEIPSFPLIQELVRRRHNNQERPPRDYASNSYEEMREEDILPTYHELPTPPIYTKTEVILENDQNDAVISQSTIEPHILSSEAHTAADLNQSTLPVSINTIPRTSYHVSVEIISHQENNNARQTTVSNN